MPALKFTDGNTVAYSQLCVKAASSSDTWNNTLFQFIHHLASLKHLWHGSVITVLKLLILHLLLLFRFQAFISVVHLYNVHL